MGATAGVSFHFSARWQCVIDQIQPEEFEKQNSALYTIFRASFQAQK